MSKINIMKQEYSKTMNQWTAAIGGLIASHVTEDLRPHTATYHIQGNTRYINIINEDNVVVSTAWQNIDARD